MGSSNSTLSNEEAAKLHVVIIGAGFGGMECGVTLKKLGVPFKIIDPKNFFHYNVGALRATVQEGN